MTGKLKYSYAIVEVEAIINSCLLTFVDTGDIEEPLTPSHPLVGRRILSLPNNLTYFTAEPLTTTNSLLAVDKSK